MKARELTPIVTSRQKSKFGRIIVLTGARQTGKTTLARRCFPSFSYLSIEDPILREDYANLTAGQWAMEHPNAILDEVQKMPQLIESIKAVYDQYDEPAYILLGSSQLLLLQKVKESLAGRCSIFEVFPLTLPEMTSSGWDEAVKPSWFQQFVNGKNRKMPASVRLSSDFPIVSKSFRHYLEFGAYPALLDDELTEEDRKHWLRNYIRTYLERDVRDLADFRNLDAFARIQRTTSALTGTLLNYSQLSREAGVPMQTARRILTYLEISYRIFMLQPWYRNQLKRLSKSPKLHYLDPGIQRTIIRRQGPMTGPEYESAILAEIYKQSRNISSIIDLYHLRTNDGREVDMLIELEEGYIAIEVKMTQNVVSQDARHLRSLQEVLDKPLLHCFVLSEDIQVKQLGDRISAIPAMGFLS